MINLNLLEEHAQKWQDACIIEGATLLELIALARRGEAYSAQDQSWRTAMLAELEVAQKRIAHFERMTEGMWHD